MIHAARARILTGIRNNVSRRCLPTPTTAAATGLHPSSSAARTFVSRIVHRRSTNSDNSSSTSSSSSSSSSSSRRLGIALAPASSLSAGLVVAACAEGDDKKARSISVGGGGGRSSSPAWLGDRMASAAANGDLAGLQKLLKEHSPVEGVNITHRYGWTPLHAAVANGRAEVVEWLLSQPGIEVDKGDVYSPRTRSLDAMVTKQNARQQAFPDFYPNQPGSEMTALHYAVLLVDLRIVDLLLAAGADPDRKEAHGLLPQNLIDWSEVPDEAKPDDHESIRALISKKRRMKPILAKLDEARAHRADLLAAKEKEERLKFPLELKLKELMVGQEVPIMSVAAAIRRRDNGWFDDQKPLVFLFLGSSGVGKTMLAKSLADAIVKDKENGFIRLDMSEFQAKHEMARMIGAPPGYVGHEQGGQLTSRLAKCNDAVILLDEVEKAHPDVLALLLQTFDEGRLTDGKGETIHCPRAVFIMTSNLVQDEIREAIQAGYLIRPTKSILSDLVDTSKKLEDRPGFTSLNFEPETNSQNGSTSSSSDPNSSPVPSSFSSVLSPPSKTIPSTIQGQLSVLANDTEQFLRFVVHPILKRAFKRDEFLGRINEYILFHPFSKEDLQQTVTMELKRWAVRAKEKHDIELDWTPALVDSLTSAFDTRYGYRSIIFAVEKRVVNVIAAAHERDKISRGCKVLLDIETPLDDHATSHQPPVVIRSVTKLDKEKDGSQTKKKFLGLF